MLLEQPVIREELGAGEASWPAAAVKELEVVGVGVRDVVVVSARGEHAQAERAPDARERRRLALVSLQHPARGQVPQAALAVMPCPCDIIPVLKVLMMQELLLNPEHLGTVTAG